MVKNQGSIRLFVSSAILIVIHNNTNCNGATGGINKIYNNPYWTTNGLFHDRYQNQPIG